MVRVLTVDDYLRWSLLVADILAAKPEVQLVGAAQTGLAGIQMTLELQPDIVILDVGLPDRSGIAVARQILELLPKTRILFLSQNMSQDTIGAAFRAGAYAYVVKSKAHRDLLPALDAVLNGKFFASTGVDRVVE